MMGPQQRPAPRGYTLMEVLVAAALLSVVSALGAKWFGETFKMINLSKSKVESRHSANTGVSRVAALLREAHIIFYSGRPLKAFPLATNANLTAVDGIANDPPTSPIPVALSADATGYAPLPSALYNFTDPTAAFGTTGYANVNQARFRFWDPGAGTSATGFLTTAGERLRTMDPAPTDPFDRYFPSPLLYLATADFSRMPASSGGAAGSNVAAGLPLSWTIRVLYLAPMRVGTDDAGLAHSPKDDATGGWPRSTVPLELRLLTIPGVEADTSGDAGHGRATDPLMATASPVPILPAPFDYTTTAPARLPNYDPIRLPTIIDGAEQLTSTNPYTWLVGATLNTRNPSGERINGGGVHTNYNQLGNDPPTQAALARTRVSAQVVKDESLVQYIDPDSVSGTCVRLLNTIRSRPHPVASGEYRRYLNAYDGEFLYNHYARMLAAGTGPDQKGGWDTANGAGALPTRALVSLTTRYRNDSRVGFQFATATEEVALESLVQFQNVDRTAE